MNILVSECLLGVHCRYDGGTFDRPFLQKIVSAGRCRFIPICPEQLGGLSTPRAPSECIEDRVVTNTGLDVTDQYNKGALAALHLAKLYGCTVAILKDRSPSCGIGQIYDGSFTGTLVDGDGVTAKLLRKNGIDVYPESKLEQLFSEEGDFLG